MSRLVLGVTIVGLTAWCGCGARSTPYDDDGGVESDAACLDEELCDDGVDNDCDGRIDEGCPECLDEELCDDGVDNDCDGEIDEGCPDCPPGVEVPTDEVCYDHIDNDCDGMIDEGCPPPECVCRAGSVRWCHSLDYDVAGLQECEADSERWGPCIEGPLYEACSEHDRWYSPDYERCLIDNGECVQDMWDLDGDGDTWESLGACRDVVCHSAEPEVCGDLLDNDFDGQVDEECSECCDECICVPGRARWCDDPRYSGIGIQPCAESGLEWGACHEASYTPVACDDVEFWYSPAYERCLIDAGECAQDMWDLDGDGDTWESLGDCADIVCP